MAADRDVVRILPLRAQPRNAPFRVYRVSSFFASFAERGDRPALRFGRDPVSYRQLDRVSAELAGRLSAHRRVAVWAEPCLETCLAVVAAIRAGVEVVPINPKLGERELEHVIGDSAPDAVVAAPNAALPARLADVPVLRVDPEGFADFADPDLPADRPAVILYTSGTTGPPKGVIISRGAITSNLDALAGAWAWTADDVVVQALPLFHAHGLLLGILGPLRRGGAAHHVGHFTPEAVADGLRDGGTMLFAVPTMYHRLADACAADASLAATFRDARLLVSGSAPLPDREHVSLERSTGQRIVQRYGLTETIMVCAMRADGDRRPGYVGPALPGVEVRLIDDEGVPLAVHDDETIGEVEVRGPNLFSGYLNRPDATEAVMVDGWFRTGDMATRAADGSYRIVGRRSTDIIKTGGYKVGAGEVESALLEHPAVAEAAVLGKPDDDLGERIIAWVVRRDGTTVDAEELSDHVRRLLSSHKRPREIRFVPDLPRNAMGKIQKAALREQAGSAASG